MDPDSSNTNTQQPTTIPLSPSSGSCAAVVEPAASSASEAVAAADLSVASAESVVSAAIPVVAAIEPQNPFAANANMTTTTPTTASGTPTANAATAPLSPAAASAASVPLEGNSGVPIPDFRPSPTVATTAAAVTAAPPPQQPQFYHPAPVAAATQPHPQQMPLHHLQQQQQHIVHPMHRRLEDDENTEPSSTNPASASLASNEARGATNAVSRFVENTRRRFGSMSNENGNGNNANNNANADGDVLDDDSGALIYGYLQKLGRNQKWQTRWFETDGECLSYYKSRKRTKLLATLDLEKVGLIAMDPEDTKEQSFTIQVLGRNYNLRADSRTVCKDWVITLNRVKEAKLQQGHIHLASPYDRVNELAPRVVVVTNRGRTRAVAETVDFDSLIAPPGSASSPTAGGTALSDAALARRSAIGTAVLARWNKRRSSLQHLSTKFTRWARSLKKYSCTDEAALLRQTSAAGNNGGGGGTNTSARSAANNHNNDPRLAGWINKEASRTTTILKPAPTSERSQSLASSEHDDRRYIS